MRSEIVEKITEIHDLLEDMELDGKDDLEEILDQFEGKLKEEFYLEFLRRLHELAEEEYSYDDIVEALEGISEDYVDVLDEDILSSLDQLLEEIEGLDGNEEVAKSMLRSYLDGLS